MEHSGLKPCPFCGCGVKLRKVLMCDNKTVRYNPDGNHKNGCQLKFAAFIGNPTTEKAAAKKWNRRADDGNVR